MTGRRFGFECELVSGAESVIYSLHKAGVAGTDSLHTYHCRCNDCQHNDVEQDGGPLFRGQQDCTVDGEIISSVLTHGTPNSDLAFSTLAETLVTQRAGVSTAAGFHVHVDKRDMTAADKLRLYRMFMRYQDNDLAELASAKERSVRSYNSTLSMDYFAPAWSERNRTWNSDYGAYLYQHSRPRLPQTCNGVTWSPETSCCYYCDRDRSYMTDLHARSVRAQATWDTLYGPDVERPATSALTPAQRFWQDDTYIAPDPGKSYWLNGFGAGNGDQTFEFRLWNATRVEWRMRLAVGVSVAMVDAAKAGVNVTENDERPLEAVIGDYMSDDTWAGVLRQRSFKDVA